MSKAEEPKKANSKDPEKIRCGLVMPISAFDDCPAEHWSEVRTIVDEALKETEFVAKLVSDRDDSGIIQAEIVRRLADDPIVICDVSGRNPNVMFELGLRLAFDKATIVIKDNRTAYPFDTSPLQYLEYPRDLHHLKIQAFEQELATKVASTYKAAEDPSYSTYLRHFVQLKPKNLPTKEVEISQEVLTELSAIRAEIRASNQRGVSSKTDGLSYIILRVTGTPENVDNCFSVCKADQNLRGITLIRDSPIKIVVGIPAEFTQDQRISFASHVMKNALRFMDPDEAS